jgi:hypothetical protein
MPFINFLKWIITRRAKREMECIKTPDIESLIEDYERLVKTGNDTGKEGSAEWRTRTTDGKNTASVS